MKKNKNKKRKFGASNRNASILAAALSLGAAWLPSSAWAQAAWMEPAYAGNSLAWRDGQRPSEGCEPLAGPEAAAFARLAKEAGVPSAQGRSCPGFEGTARTNPPGVAEFGKDFWRLSRCEKAFAAGHELAHLALRHAEEEAEAIAGLRRLKTGAVEDAYAEKDFDLSVGLATESLSREQERQADRVGLLLAATEDCAPEEAAAFFKSTEDSKPSMFLDAHDDDADRIGYLKAFAPSARRVRESLGR